MKLRLTSMILIFCIILTALPALGIWADSSGGYVYGFVEDASYDEYENVIELSTASEGLDDFDMANYYDQLPISATINGTSYSSADDILKLLTPGAAICYRTDEVDFGDYWREGIVEIWIDNTPSITGTYSYDSSSATFSGLDSSTEGLPVLFFNDGWLKPVYLDKNHTYDIQVYDYGILVTDMQATGGREMIWSVQMKNNPTEKFLADFTFTATASRNGGVLNTTIQDSYGNQLQSKTASFETARTNVTFTDLPNVSAGYIVTAWITRNGSAVSPVYEYYYLQEPYDTMVGTILSITPQGRYALNLELDIGETWTRDVELRVPAIVDGVRYEDLASLQTAPLLTVGSFIRYAAGDNLWIVGNGATTWGNYGRLNSAKGVTDGAKQVLEVSMTLPDGSTQDYKMDETATINDQSYATLHDVYLALEEGFGGYAGFEISGERISKLSYRTDYIDFYDQEYEGEYDFFQALPETAKNLPVYYKINEDDFAEAYLDEQHFYDINYYDGFAVEITRMTAKEEGQFVIHRTTPSVAPNKNFLLDLMVSCKFDSVEDGYLMVRVDDSEYNAISDGYVRVLGSTGTVVIPDLPNTQETYRISAWLVDAAFDSISPGYEKEYQVTPLPTGTGTIFDTSYFDAGGWMVLTMESASGVEGKSFSCTSPVYINGYSYTDPYEMGILLKNGLQMEYMLDKDGNIGAIQYDDEKEYLYGYFQNYGYDWDEDDNYYMEVTFLLPDLTERTCRVNLDSWINGHRAADWDELHDIFWDSTGRYCTFATVGSTINTLKISEDTSVSYNKATYDGATGTFFHQSLSNYDKKLPIYCSMSPDYEYILPYLDENHYYTIDIYDYAIVITGMEAKDKSATITSIKTSVYPDDGFNYQVGVSVKAVGAGSNSVLKAQLLNTENQVVRETGAAGTLSASLLRIPNKAKEYTLRVWIEENGAPISHFYTKTVSVPRGTVCYGTLLEDSYLTSDGELKVKLKDPKMDVGVETTVFCTTGDTIPGCPYNSLEELQGVLKEGTMVRYMVSSANKVQALEVLKVMNAIRGTDYNKDTKQLSAHIHLQSTDSKPAIGTIYAGVYTKDGVLKRVETIENQELPTGGTVMTTIRIQDVDYENGDYVKVHYWTPNNAAIANPAEWDLVKE